MPNGVMSCVGTVTGYFERSDTTTMTVTTDRARTILNEVTVTAGAELLSDARWNEATTEGEGEDEDGNEEDEETSSGSQTASDTDNAAFRTAAQRAFATGLAVAAGGAMIII
jgi:hypothetical protein